MQPTIQATPISRARLWTARVLGGLAVLFMIFDGVIKLVKPAPVVESFNQLGYPVSLAVGIGLLQLCCVAVYTIPRTAILGAILLTGYLGGATATHVRMGGPTFSIVFPVIIGALLWGGLYLTDGRLRALLPLRR